MANTDPTHQSAPPATPANGPRPLDAGMLATRDSVGTETIQRHDPAAIAMAAKAEALVHARITQALARPRDYMIARDRLLGACARPTFADSAIYAKPIGGETIEGLSIRFAEEALRCWGNLAVEQVVVFDGPRQKIVAVTGTDLETNVTVSIEVAVEKTVERKHPKKGDVVLSQRQNSYGETVYLVEANEDALAVKVGAAVAKARRQVILQLIPGDLQDDAKAACYATLEKGSKAVDPAAKRKELIDEYREKHRISADQLAAFLGHPLDKATSDEFLLLHKIKIGLNEGLTTWAEVMASRETVDEETGEVRQEAGTAAGKSVLDAIAKARAKQEATKAPAPAAPAATPAAAPKAEEPAKEPAPDPAAVRAALAEQFVREAKESTAETIDDVVSRALAAKADNEVDAAGWKKIESAIVAAKKRLEK